MAWDERVPGPCGICGCSEEVHVSSKGGSSWCTNCLSLGKTEGLHKYTKLPFGQEIKESDLYHLHKLRDGWTIMGMKKSPLCGTTRCVRLITGPREAIIYGHEGPPIHYYPIEDERGEDG